MSVFGDNVTTSYFYIKNLMGDICEIADKDGNTVASYYYDAWGTLLKSEGDENILRMNPLTYRGYLYDEETGLYYLQTCYYNPEWNRFLNADTNLDTQTSIIGTNVFAYCDNNPVMNTDNTGRSTDLSSLTEDEGGRVFIELLKCLVGLQRHGGIIADIRIEVEKFVITAIAAKIIEGTVLTMITLAASVAIEGILAVSTIAGEFYALAKSIIHWAQITAPFSSGLVKYVFNSSIKDIMKKINIFSDITPGMYIYGNITVLEIVNDGFYIREYYHYYNFIFGPAGTSLDFSYYIMYNGRCGKCIIKFVRIVLTCT